MHIGESPSPLLGVYYEARWFWAPGLSSLSLLTCEQCLCKQLDHGHVPAPVIRVCQVVLPFNTMNLIVAICYYLLIPPLVFCRLFFVVFWQGSDSGWRTDNTSHSSWQDKVRSLAKTGQTDSFTLFRGAGIAEGVCKAKKCHMKNLILLARYTYFEIWSCLPKAILHWI